MSRRDPCQLSLNRSITLSLLALNFFQTADDGQSKKGSSKKAIIQKRRMMAFLSFRARGHDDGRYTASDRFGLFEVVGPGCPNPKASPNRWMRIGGNENNRNSPTTRVV
jgi:hypothetical protein